MIKRDLNYLYPVFRQRVMQFLGHMNMHDCFVSPYETIRSIARQERLCASGASRTKVGYHLYGLACDVYPCYANGTFMGGEELTRWFDTGDVQNPLTLNGVKFKNTAKQLGLTWGGNWKMRDYVHLQMDFGIATHTLSYLLLNGGKNRLWDFVTDWRKNHEQLDDFFKGGPDA